MGAKGSGGQNRLTDEEKKARGTFRADRSDDVYDQRAAAKVLQGPWLSAIPEPTLPLSGAARGKYDEWTKLLFDQGRLTQVAVSEAQVGAIAWGKVATALEKGKSPATADLNLIKNVEKDLRIAADAPVLASPTRSRFADSGFANSRTSPIRLLTAADLSKERQNG